MGHLQDAPFFHVSRKGNKLETRGMTSCLLGHKVNRAPDTIPDGVFAEWEWDGRQLRVRNCRYGLYPLYYFSVKDEVCVSNSIPKLLAEGAPTELDEAALAVFLRLGFFIGEDTPFRAIRQVPPNTTFRWKDGTLEVSGQLLLGRLQRLNRKSAIEGYIEHFKAAIHRRLPSSQDFVVPLSGGRDSRHILFELVEAGYSPKFCITSRHYPRRPSKDVEVAAQLCKALDLRHVVLDPPKSRVRAELVVNVETSFCSDEGAWLLSMAEYLKGKVEIVYHGIGGDTLSSGSYQSDEKLRLYASDLRKLAETLLEAWTPEFVLRGLLKQGYYRKFSLGLAADHLVIELKKYTESANPLQSFYFWNRIRREMSLVPFGLLRSFRVFCPYIDHDLYDFLVSLPTSIVLDHKFHTEAIQRAYPQHNYIPFEKKRTALVNDRGYYRRLARQLAFYITTRGNSQMVNTSLILPRLFLCAISGDFRLLWWNPIFALYLLQIEAKQCQDGIGGD